MRDIGILASLDPVALDKACLDLVFEHESTSGDNASPLQQRIESRHGTHIVDYAEQIGFGSRTYELIDIDEPSSTESVTADNALRYNVYNLEGVKLLTNARSLKSLPSGIYIVNGKKTVIK